MQRLPKQRRTGLFSATQTEAVEELARAGLRNPMRVAVKQGMGGKDGGKAVAGESKTPSQLCLEYSLCEADVKIARFVSFLKAHANRKVSSRERRPPYSDGQKVSNRTVRVWHGATEHGP
jgi:ATP-dependent RNA helicase DDX55/SPB4